MRIVAGRNRGRAIEAPAGLAIRPTADRARQAVFDVLMHSPDVPPLLLDGAVVLDAFAGTGAMGLEALSRGAASCYFLDGDARAIACIRANAQRLNDAARAKVIKADMLAPPQAPASATLAFLDPPYGKQLCAPALHALAAKGWLGPGAIVVVEQDGSEELEGIAGFAAFDRRRYGRAAFVFLRHTTPEPPP